MLSSSVLTVTGSVQPLLAASRVSFVEVVKSEILFLISSFFLPVFDLESKSIVDELKPEFVGVGKNSADPECLSLAWSADGSTLFAGYSDNKVRIFTVG